MHFQLYFFEYCCCILEFRDSGTVLIWSVNLCYRQKYFALLSTHIWSRRYLKSPKVWQLNIHMLADALYRKKILWVSGPNNLVLLKATSNEIECALEKVLRRLKREFGGKCFSIEKKCPWYLKNALYYIIR